jgi:hypothetical protein
MNFGTLVLVLVFLVRKYGGFSAFQLSRIVDCMSSKIVLVQFLLYVQHSGYIRNAFSFRL